MGEQREEEIPGEGAPGGGAETDWPSIKPDLGGGEDSPQQDPDDPRDPPHTD